MSGAEWLPDSGSPPKPHGHKPFPQLSHNSINSSSGNLLELAVVNQRLIGVEDRLHTLELLVAKTVAKLDEQSSRLAAEIRTAEFARLQQQVAGEGQEQFARHVREQLEKLVSAAEAQDERIGRVTREVSEQSTGRFETRLARTEAKVASVDQAQREAVTAGARQLAHAVKLLQSHIAGQVESLAASVETKMNEAEKERSDFLARSQEMQTTFLALRNAVNETRSAAGQVESELSLIHAAHDQLAEDVKVLSRRLMSAVRHLATNPNDYLEQPVVAAAAVDVVKTPPPHGRRLEPTGAAAAEAQAPPHRSHLPPPPSYVTSGGEIDAFIAELNFLTRNTSAA